MKFARCVSATLVVCSLAGRPSVESSVDLAADEDEDKNKCNSVTKGTCAHLDCNDSRGAVCAKEGKNKDKCVCKKGFCASDDGEKCVKECKQVTVGTCAHLDCNDSRGAVCGKKGANKDKCICKKDECASDDGEKCVPIKEFRAADKKEKKGAFDEEDKPSGKKPDILTDTKKASKKEAKKDSKKEAKKDSKKEAKKDSKKEAKKEAKKGALDDESDSKEKCITKTKGTCAHLKCDASRGAVCEKDVCVCKKGWCASSDEEKCIQRDGCKNKVTKGTCAHLKCDGSRNAQCESSGEHKDKCVCGEGLCASDDGDKCVPFAALDEEDEDDGKARRRRR